MPLDAQGLDEDVIDIEWVQLMLLARHYGFSVEEIRELLQNPTHHAAATWMDDSKE